MAELDAVTILLSFIITWGIGLAPPLLIRYIFLKRPVSRWPAIGICASFWVFNVILFTALGSKSRSHFALTLVAFVSYWLLRRSEKRSEDHGPTATELQDTTMPGTDERKTDTGFVAVPVALQPVPTPASNASSDEGFINEHELAVIAKHDGVKEVVVQGYGVDPTVRPKFITHYLVRVNGRRVYRQSAVRPGDNLQALAGWIGLNHGPTGKGPNSNPFEFESVEEVADVLGRAGIARFAVQSHIVWNKVHITFDI